MYCFAEWSKQDSFKLGTWICSRLVYDLRGKAFPRCSLQLFLCRTFVCSIVITLGTVFFWDYNHLERILLIVEMEISEYFV